MAAELPPHPGPLRSHPRRLSGLLPLRLPPHHLEAFMQLALGTCGGFQHLVLEFARNVMGIQDASHAETDPYASCLFITPLGCSLAGKTMEVTLKSGSRAATACQSTHTSEQYYCNFGLNPEYHRQLEEHGLAITGVDENGE